MFGFFQRDPVKILERKRADKYREAMEARKYGDRAGEADLYAEANVLEQQIARLVEAREATAA